MAGTQKVILASVLYVLIFGLFVSFLSCERGQISGGIPIFALGLICEASMGNHSSHRSRGAEPLLFAGRLVLSNVRIHPLSKLQIQYSRANHEGLGS